MAACSSLQVILRVEVAIHKNYSVGSCKVDANSSCNEKVLQSQSFISENNTHAQLTDFVFIIIDGLMYLYWLHKCKWKVSLAFLHQCVTLLQFLSQHDQSSFLSQLDRYAEKLANTAPCLLTHHKK